MELGQTNSNENIVTSSMRVAQRRTTLCERLRQRTSEHCRWSSPNFLPERKSRNEAKRRTLISWLDGAPPNPPTSPSREPRAYLAGLFFDSELSFSLAPRLNLFLSLSFIHLYEKRHHFVRQIL